jgi:hypothetical protein
LTISFGTVKIVQQVLGGIAKGLEQDRDTEIYVAVDTDVNDILGIDLQVDPGSATGMMREL